MIEILKEIIAFLIAFVLGSAMLVTLVAAVIMTVGFWINVINDFIVEPIKIRKLHRKLSEIEKKLTDIEK